MSASASFSTVRLKVTGVPPLFPGTAYAPTTRAGAWRRLSSALPQKDACRRMVALLALAHDEACETELGKLIDPGSATGSRRRPAARCAPAAWSSPTARTRAARPRGAVGTPQPHSGRAGRAHRARQPGRPLGSPAVTARQADVHKLPAMLTALRLPSFQAQWQDFAERADPLAQDGEGWSAAEFLAALAECEFAERETRRIQRHLAGLVAALRGLLAASPAEVG